MTKIIKSSSSEELEFPKVNRFIFDWVSFSFRGLSISELIDRLGLAGCPWEIMTSGNGYTHRHFFNQISISFCEDMSHVNGFYLLEMSGQGCRAFETYGTGDYDFLFDLVRGEFSKDVSDRNFRLTRLDVAYDDVNGSLDIDQICDKTRLGHFTCRMKTYQVIYGSKGNSVTFGRKGSNAFIRIYDKARERGFTDGRHWIRCEVQLRSDAALGFCNKLSDRDPWLLYAGILKHYLLFREEDPNDSNKSRWDVSSWWLKFIDYAAAVSLLSRPGVLYNLSKAEKYFFTQPIGTVKTLLKIYGSKKFLDLIKSAPMPNNPKYDQLIKTVAQDLDRSLHIVPEISDLSSDDDLMDGYDDRIKAVLECDDIDRIARSRAQTTRQSYRPSRSGSKFVPSSITCQFCGKKGSVDLFWTYQIKTQLGECYDCKTAKTDAWLKSIHKHD